MPISEAETPPILRHKSYETSSAFTPENLLRQARRQKRLPNIAVPEICILDPDGDIVRNLRATGRASRHAGWPCYHTELYVFCHDGHEYGIVGCAVGAAFAVLIAEERSTRKSIGARGDEFSHPEKMRQRRETVEHPFGTIKARMGATHFLMKTLPRVASEMALHVLGYNLTRVMNIMGIRPLMAAMRA